MSSVGSNRFSSQASRQSGGVNGNVVFVCLTALVAFCIWQFGGGWRPFPPAPLPAPDAVSPVSPAAPADLDLSQVIVGADLKIVREDAAYLAAVLDYSADRLVKVEAIQTWKQHDDYFRSLGAIAAAGRTKGKYPLLPSALDSWLSKRSTGADGQSIKFDRVIVAGWHREIAAALRRAAK